MARYQSRPGEGKLAAREDQLGESERTVHDRGEGHAGARRKQSQIGRRLREARRLADSVPGGELSKTKKTGDDATKWYDQALKAIDEQIKVKANYLNLTRRVNILLNAGRTQEG